jgi:hypothetical protein
MSSETMSSAAIKRLSLSFLLFYCVASAALQVAPDALSTTLPARTIQGYLMIVSVRINDQGPFDFLVDTGTNSTLIDPALAKQLALQAKDKLRLSSLAKSAAVSRYFLQKFNVGLHPFLILRPLRCRSHSSQRSITKSAASWA